MVRKHLSSLENSQIIVLTKNNKKSAPIRLIAEEYNNYLDSYEDTLLNHFKEKDSLRNLNN